MNNLKHDEVCQIANACKNHLNKCIETINAAKDSINTNVPVAKALLEELKKRSYIEGCIDDSPNEKYRKLNRTINALSETIQKLDKTYSGAK